MNNDHFAHTLNGELPDKWQPLGEHLANVAKNAALHAEPFASAEWGKLAGHWHDLGKYTKAFQDKLLASINAYSFSKPKALKEIYKSCLEQLDHLN